MLLIDGIIYSLQKHGGITVYFNELLQRMGEVRNDCRVLLHEGSAANIEFMKSGYDVFPMRSAERYRRCPVSAQVSLFHSSYYRLPNRCVPVVTTVHDFIYERHTSGPRRWVHSWQKYKAIRGSHAVICISESTKRDLLQYLPDIQPDRIHVVYNGVSSKFYPLSTEVMPASATKPYVLFVGARKGYKNFIPLVQAMAGLRELDLLCIGGGVLTLQESELVQRYLSGRFAHHMAVSDVQLNQFYNGAHCLVYPSAYEGFGIPLLEAMRAGCPVVALNSSSIPEVAGDAAQLLSDASPEELRAAISRFDQKEQRGYFRQLGLQRASIFSWDRTFAETSKVYEAAMSNFLNQ